MTWLRSLCRKFAVPSISHSTTVFDGDRIVHLNAYRVPQACQDGVPEGRDWLRRLASIWRIVVGEIWRSPNDPRHRARQRAYVVMIALVIADFAFRIGM